jgi:hypothetical protein
MTLVSWNVLGTAIGAQRLWFFGFALLALGAFVAALRAADRLPGRTLLGLALACQLAVVMARPLTSHDVLANLTYGRILEQGGDPFVTTPRTFLGERPPGPTQMDAPQGFGQLIDEQWRDTPCAYGPVVAVLGAAAVRIGTTPAGALLVFKLLAALAAGLGLVLARRMATDAGRPARFALLGLNPLYAWELTGQAHNDAFVVPLVALFVWGVRRDKVMASACAAGLSFLVKPVLLPVYGLWVVAQIVTRTPTAASAGPPRWRRAALAVVIPAVILMLGWLPFWTGPGTLAMAYKSLLGGHVQAANSIGEAFCHLAAFIDPAWAAPTLALVRGLGLAVVAWAGIRAMGRVAKGADVIDEGLVVMLILMGVVAWFQPWYVVWALPLAVVTRAAPIAVLTAGYAATFMAAYVSNQYGTSWFVHAGMLLALVWLRRSSRSKPN